MTRERVRALQASQPAKPARMVPCTIHATSPLTVELPGGAIVAGVPIAGLTYTVGNAATVLIQEPAVGPVYPHA